MAEIYSDSYIDQCFYIWYESGKSYSKDLVDKLPKTDRGNSPSILTLQKWGSEYGWLERADALDGQLSVAMDNSIINRRVAMYEKHAEVGKDLIERASKFFEEHGGIKTENAALRAMELGMETERKSVGVADYVRKLSEMTPDQLDRELANLLGPKKEEEFIIDGETKEEEPK